MKIHPTIKTFFSYQIPFIFYLMILLPSSLYGSSDLSHNTVQIDTLLNKAWKFRSIQIDSMEWYSLKALELSQTIGYPKGEGDALNTIGFKEFISGHYEKSIDYLEAATLVLDPVKHKEVLAQTKNFMGLVYWSKSELDKALIHQL